MDWVIVDSVVGFEQDQLTISSGIKSFENNSCAERAEEGSPEDLSWEVRADFLTFVNDLSPSLTL